MTTFDALDGLDAVDWAGLRHAYGPAGDVPAQIRALTSDDPATCESALGALYGNIFHQGSRYEASTYAVPFLVGLAADTATPGRAEILALIGALTVGFDESHLPQGLDITGRRAEVEELRSGDRDTMRRRLEKWVDEAVDEGDRRVREMRLRMFDPEESYESARHESAVYDAVRAQVPRLAVLLDDPDPRVRAQAAYTLAWFPEESEHILPRLHGLLAVEPLPSVEATALIATALMASADDAGTARVLRRRLSAGEPVVRWAAATGLARLGSPDEEVVEILAAAVVDPPEQGVPGIPFHEGDLRGYASIALVAADRAIGIGALDVLLAGLARTSGPSAFAVTAAALHTAFGSDRPYPLPPYKELDAVTRKVVRALAELDEHTWQWANFRLMLRPYNLPGDRAACRRYVGSAAEPAEDAPF
ncbi:HEAT repeat domain-containing protein [Embleya hyalina]|uniref:HEAT repeat domain-containing protein n=1 Tax=Embleya hyalina TaxID=516124 RepID=A0A401YQL6_9ACTN|nr:HEAT repeat domain-containing protein [Embleya hyalina]GCD96835.1 hypothetical protein EHYA_04522 [Embleya hyalina]